MNLTGNDGVGIYSASPDADWESHAHASAKLVLVMGAATATITAVGTGESTNRILIADDAGGSFPPTVTTSGNTVTIHHDLTANVSDVVSAINTASTIVTAALTGTDDAWDASLLPSNPMALHGGAAITGRWGDRARQYDNGDDSTGPVNGGQGWPTWDAPVPTLRTVWWSLTQTYLSSNALQGAAWQSLGGGAGHSATADWNATYGVYFIFSTGTTSTGSHGAVLGSNSVSCILFGASGHQWRYESAVQIPTLSDGTESFYCYTGFCTTGQSGPGNDCAVVNFPATGGNIEAVCRNAGVETRVDTGIAQVAGSDYRVVIVATNNTQVDFYIAQVGQPLPSTPTTTITTNLPTHIMVAGTSITKAAGTTARTMNCYYQMVSLNRLAA